MQTIAHSGLIAPSSRSHEPFPFWRPTDLDEALDAIANAPLAPVIFAGGTDLCAQFNEGLTPTAMVALDRVAELKTIRLETDRLVIGSMVTHAQGSTDELVRRHLPGFAKAWGMAANARVRFWATIGGNLMARRVRYELSLMLAALGATLRFARPDGTRFEISTEELWTANLDQRSLLLDIVVPCGESARFDYERSLRPTLTIALASGFDAGATAAIATEWLRPLVLRVRPELSPVRAAEDAFEAMPPSFADPATSHWYLRDVGQTLLRRMLEAHDGR